MGNRKNLPPHGTTNLALSLTYSDFTEKKLRRRPLQYFPMQFALVIAACHCSLLTGTSHLVFAPPPAWTLFCNFGYSDPASWVYKSIFQSVLGFFTAQEGFRLDFVLHRPFSPERVRHRLCSCRGFDTVSLRKRIDDKFHACPPPQNKTGERFGRSPVTYLAWNATVN